MSNSALQIVDAPVSATWAEARKLFDRANRTAGEAVAYAIQCGRVLRELRDQTSHGAGRPKLSNVGQLFSDELEKAGIPRSTAYDWIAQAGRLDELIAISAGKQKQLRIEVETAEGIKEVDRPLKDIDRERAARQLSEIEAGRLWPKRAWAGFRSGLVTASAKRAPADVCKLIHDALATLDRQLPKLKTLTDDERLLLKKYASQLQIVERIAALEDLQ